MFICTISVFHKYGKQILDEMLQPLHLDWRSMVVLLVVDQVPGISQGRLIPFLQTDKANVAKLLKEMEEKDLLERREGEGDLRIKNCHLTLKSSALMPELKKIMKDWEEQCFSGITETEKEVFLKVSRQIGYNLTGYWEL